MDELINKKHRASYLTPMEVFNIQVACGPILDIFNDAIYHVGSSLFQLDYRDIDLRCILFDEEYDKFISSKLCLKFLNSVITEWLITRTKLPIDFQFQRMTEANIEFKGLRHALMHYDVN